MQGTRVGVQLQCRSGGQPQCRDPPATRSEERRMSTHRPRIGVRSPSSQRPGSAVLKGRFSTASIRPSTALPQVQTWSTDDAALTGRRRQELDVRQHGCLALGQAPGQDTTGGRPALRQGPQRCSRPSPPRQPSSIGEARSPPIQPHRQVGGRHLRAAAHLPASTGKSLCQASTTTAASRRLSRAVSARTRDLELPRALDNPEMSPIPSLLQ